MTTNILGILRLIAMASRRRHPNVYDRRRLPATRREAREAQEAVDSCKAALTECDPQVRRVRAGG